MYWTMGELEKNQHFLKRMGKKIEDRLTSIESKGNEDVEVRQWNDFDYGRDEGKDNSEKGEEDKENSKSKSRKSEKGEDGSERWHSKSSEIRKNESRKTESTTKAQGTTKKRGRPKKNAATLKPCTPSEKRKGEPSRWVQSPFNEGKTDELEVPKKKPKTKA
ncbi:hypothetical protein Bca52824_019337 [Brassica carinata]|uniref:Uncharacterized protein n=1 Tax=Brassica carinata TaxID=52824 RepID=A0A8X7VSR7_BRACI|nr:hypothetical protein Bca52824_019337 [Brassica carinata]